MAILLGGVGGLGAPDYKSAWTAIANGASNYFAHNLNTRDLLVQVWFDAANTGLDKRTFNVAGDGSGSRIIINTANDIYVENQLGANRYFQVIAWKY